MRNRRGGFTLVEIMIVVAIISLLVSIAMPSFVLARKRAQNAHFMNDLRVISDSVEEFAMDNGSYPPDVTPGVVPPGMSSYFHGSIFTEPTPLGGQWDWDFNYSFKAAVTVVGFSADDAQILPVDEKLDDGNFQTGFFRKAGNRISLVLEP